MKRLSALFVVLAILIASSGAGAVDNTKGDRRAAAALVRKKGYRPALSSWDSFFRFNLLIGTYAKSADGYSKRAFFFFGHRYLGTDAANPSAQIEEVWRDDRTIAVLYILYRQGDPLCCPTAGGAIVRFHWTGSRVVALDPIPPLNGSGHR